MKYLSIIQALSKGLLYPQVKCTWIFHEGQILCPSTKQIVWQSSSWSESNQCSDASYFHCHSSLCKLQPPQTTSFTRTGIHDCMDILIECGCMIICTHILYTNIHMTQIRIYIYTGIYIHITCIYTNIHLRHCFFVAFHHRSIAITPLYALTCVPWRAHASPVVCPPSNKFGMTNIVSRKTQGIGPDALI